MPDTFDQLCERMPLFPRTKPPEPLAPGWVDIEAVGIPWCRSRMTFILLMDGRPLKSFGLTGGKVTFPVWSGEHRFRVQFVDFFSAPLMVRVEPGERVALTCAVNEPLYRFVRQFQREILIAGITGLIAGAVVWFAFPMLEAAVLKDSNWFVRAVFSIRLGIATMIGEIIVGSTIIGPLIRHYREKRRLRTEPDSGFTLSIGRPESKKKPIPACLLDFD